MGERPGAAADAGRIAVLANEVRAASRLGMVGMAIMALVLAWTHHAFAAIVRPPILLDLWVGGMACVVVYFYAAMAVFLYRRPGDAETVGEWTKYGGYAQTGLNIGITISPWVLMPHADPGLQSLTTLLYVWYVSIGIMTNNAAVPMPAWEVAMLTLSVAGFALWNAGPYAPALAFFLIMIGLTMLSLRTMVRQSVLKALAAQEASDRSEATTRVALAAAAAERDAKTRFIAAASHDLQQPLHAASLFFDAALAMPEGAERRQAIAGAHSAFGSTQALLESMLDHLRLEAGAVRPRLEPLPVGPLLAAVAFEHGAAARAAGMAIRVVPGRLVANADSNLLKRALGNLVANAIRHARGEHVLIAARARGGAAELWVVDDGRGIPDGEGERLFDDFAQGGAGGAGGFGLGLASVRRRMALMGGSAAHEPLWRGGAAFVLRLPLVAGPRLAIAAE
jgi:signal transduction histidine kinase